MTITKFILKFKTSLRYIRNIIIIIAKINKMEVHQASIYIKNKKSIEIKYWCLFLSTWSHNAIVVDLVFLRIYSYVYITML